MDTSRVRRNSVLSAAAVLMASAPWGVPAAQAVEGTPAPQYLFTLNAERGTSTAVGKDSGERKFVLTLRGVSSRATQFADRPFRNAYLQSTRTLIKKWDTWFQDSPPNAVLTFTSAKRSKDPAPRTIVVTLAKPKYSPKSDTLRFTARHLHRSVSPVNGDKVTSPKRRPPAQFLRASLFIDTVSIDSVVNGCALQRYADCPNADLSDEYLNDFDLLGSNFTGANFSGTYLPGVQLAQSTLNGAKFVGAVGLPTGFQGAYLIGADLTKAKFVGSQFADANMTAANLTDADLSQSQLTHTLLQGAFLRRTDLRGANLENAVVAGATVEGVLTDSTTKCPNGSAGPCLTADQWRPLGPTSIS